MEAWGAYMNVPPTELARRLKAEKDPAKRRAMRRALDAWRLVEGNPLAREARTLPGGTDGPGGRAEGMVRRVARAWLLSLASL